MQDWVPILIVIAVVCMIIGTFSTLNKSAKQPLRKKSLNELEETLPRTNRVKNSSHDKDKADSN